MVTAIDVRPEVEFIEISMRWLFVYLGIPEQPDFFWDDMAAELTTDFGEAAEICLNASAVMADASQFANALNEES